MNAHVGLLFVSISFAAVSCAEDEPWTFTDVAPKPAFVDNINGAYPILLRDCSFFACHGSDERLFRVWGPSRKRLEKLPPGADQVAMGMLEYAEMKATYDSALGFIDINDPERSLLLRKGLDEQAGGSGHLGLDKFGRNVYSSAQSPGYLALAHWVFSLRQNATSEE